MWRDNLAPNRRQCATSFGRHGPKHPSVAQSLETYAVLPCETGRTTEADKTQARTRVPPVDYGDKLQAPSSPIFRRILLHR